MKKTRVRSILVLLFASAILISSCTSSSAASSWPGISGEGEAGYISYGTQVYALDITNGSIIWRYPEDADNSTQFYAPPAIGEKLVVVGSFNNSLAAVDKKSGTSRWLFEDADDRFIASQLITDNFVYAPNADGYLYVLDKNGDLIWRFKTGGPNWSKPLTDGNNIYLASMDHNLYALAPEYKSSDLTLDADGSRTLVSEPVWGVDLGSAIVANPVVANETIYIATVSGEVFAVNPNNGKILWKFGNPDDIGSIWAEPSVYEGTVFVVDDSGKLNAIDSSNGTAIWPSPYDAGDAVIASSVVTTEGLLYATGEGRIFLIDSEKKPVPVTLLETPIYSTPLFIDGNIILAPGSRDELVRAIDLNGNVIWNFTPEK